MKKALFLPFLLLITGPAFSLDMSIPVTNGTACIPLTGFHALAIPRDDPSFRNTSYDDSRWIPITIGTNLLKVFPADTRIAWYRLHLRFPEKPPLREWGIYLGEIYDADEVYFNGQRIGAQGSMDASVNGPSGHAYERDRFYAIPTPLVRTGKDNVLAVRVRGPFDGKLGIMNTAPYLSPAEEYYRGFFIGGFRDIAFILVYLTISGYFILFFVRRPKERDYLYFGLYTLALAGYSFLRTEFRYLLSDNFYVMKKIEYMILYATAGLFPAYVYAFFKKKPPLVIKAFYAVMFVGALTVAVTDSPQFWSIFNIYMQYVFFAAFLFPFGLMFSRLRSSKDAKAILASFLLLLAAAVNDTLVSRDILHTPLLMSYFFFFVVVCLALILANRFVRVNKEVEDLNVNLERKVEDRTKELNFANQELLKRQEIMDEQMKIAERVQLTMVPQGTHMPVIPELDFGALFKPMEKIGGDIYDIIRIDYNHAGFLIADVSGHGVPSALVTAMLKAVFSYHAREGKAIAEIVRNVNEEMFRLLADVEQYYTAFFGVFDLEKNIFSYSNAGHYPVLMRRSASGEWVHLTTDGIIGGKFTGLSFGEGRQSYETGDSFLFYTDGIIEAKNCDEQYYGMSRLKEFAGKNPEWKADRLVKELYADVEDFCEGAPADDDRTLLYVKAL